MTKPSDNAPSKKWGNAGPLVFSEMEIGSGDEEGLPVLIEAARAIFPDSQIVVQAGHFFIAARYNGNLIGFSHIHPASKGACIRGIGVLPAWRKRGIGTRLLEKSLALCEQRFSGKEVRLKVKAANEEALRLYARYGFVMAKSEGSVHTLKRSPPT